MGLDDGFAVPGRLGLLRQGGTGRGKGKGGDQGKAAHGANSGCGVCCTLGSAGDTIKPRFREAAWDARMKKGASRDAPHSDADSLTAGFADRR
ncbi:hypothetical protein GCM10011402_15170 [Paracoccus acridae]|uniref:Uncharacterized protein n=1 Tax=Paracoccus acridae TaxID=1795310 RepID=A0ABQ1VG27_9RHOB|nr:hypothetical protein GCM10011402_15170 [Paracoccus acridae]